ncbi:RNase P subunit [Komagataella phaffii CBS 7435]|uniref:RNase P subunit n=1 Tax=Komagataella phaffii (strain ATCC 76273 / CBS 7435 / CECT 11047 / NRRL Y-11430 / Wegner 21-1) TaxID=981350 RepID=F2QWD6_KOMPC|nr:GQ67_03520T0 [Komagataella phaffii]AOA68672.1 GQ68_03490T0 [Komagataella phaffii GS115]CAH2449741.1 RNase P subunit [Komagataella phaffii CBS 7435]CCA39714.1 RNase P subunit [Komagataella phaffii CBS 7435]
MTNSDPSSKPLRKLKLPKQTPKRDQYTRISYLYQASASSNGILSRMYSRQMDLVAKKTVLKISPTIKRTICKTCYRHLKPGVTYSPEIVNESKKKAPRNDILQLQCICGQIKRFPYGKDPNYKAHNERSLMGRNH